MKGLSAVVALILTLVVTVSLAGAFVLWSSSLTSTLQTEQGAKIEESQKLYSVPIIDHVAGHEVFIRNGGGQQLSGSSLAFFIDSQPAAAFPRFATLAPGEVGIVNITNLYAFGRGSKALRVTSGGTDEKSIVIEPAPGSVWGSGFDEIGATETTEFLANPGFETYTTSPGAPSSWNQNGAATQLTKETTIIHGGLNALKITKDGSTSNPGAYQSEAGLSDARSYLFEAYARTAGGANEQAWFRIELKDSAGATIGSVAVLGTIGIIEWERLFFVWRKVPPVTSVTLTAYTTSGTPTGGIVYYDDISIKEIQLKDASGGNRHGNLASGDLLVGPKINEAGIIGTSYKFDGSSYVRTGSHSAVSGLTGDKSVGAWMKKTAGSNAGIVLANNVDVVSAGAGWSFVIRSNKLALSISNANNDGEVQESDGSIAGTEWHYVAVSYDSVTEQVKFYIDGSLDSAKTFAKTSHLAGGFFQLAAEDDRSAIPHEYPLNGNLDEVWVFNKVLEPFSLFSMRLA